jgi:uncharacterized protein
MKKSIPSKFCLYALLLFLMSLSACGLPAAPQESHWKAEEHFEGKAVDLANAAAAGDAQTIRRLMKDEGVNPDVIFAKDAMPLIAWPILTESPAGLKAMLENGANPNARMIDKTRDRGQQRNNAMVLAAGWPEPQYLELLLKHGGDPNTRNSNDETLLLTAWLNQQQWRNTKLLILNGADINKPDSDDPQSPYTVISWHALTGRYEEVYWLLEHGADPTKRWRGGIHPPEGTMMVVDQIFWGISSEKQIPWQRKCQQWLIKKGIQRSDKMPEEIRSDRKELGFPFEEKDVPLL